MLSGVNNDKVIYTADKDLEHPPFAGPSRFKCGPSFQTNHQAP